MAKAQKGAGGFSQMPKMITDEPTVILKLKKGGSAHHKHGGKHEEHGHKSMKHMAMGGMPNMTTLPARGGVAPTMAPKMGALAVRRAAMRGMPAPLMAKKGGKTHKAEGGKVEKDIHKVEKELKHHEKMKDSMHGGKAHMKKGGHAKKHMAEGGEMLGKKIDQFESRSAIENDAPKYLQTMMHDGEHHDSAHGTGEVKENNAGGYKHGGKAHHADGGKVHHMTGHPEGTYEHHKAMAKHYSEKCKDGGSAHMHKMHEHHKHMAKMCKGGKYAVGGTVSEGVAKRYENTMMHDGETHDSAHGTGEVKESNAGGFKHGGKAHHKHGGKHFAKGGSTNWENRPADTAHPDHAHGTGEVKESNAGGYKHGGKAKKHFATGGAVNKQGSAVAMPQGRKAPPKPVFINQLSGTYKKGGKVKHFGDGGDMQFAPDQDMKNVTPQDVADAKLRAKQTRAFDQASGSMSDYESNRMGQTMNAPNPLSRRGMGAMTDSERQRMSIGKKHGGRAKK